MSSAAPTAPVRPLAERIAVRRGWWLRVAGATAVVTVALLFAAHWYLIDRVRVFTDDAIVDANQVFVTTRVPERVVRILVEENQFVRRGQTLAVLDDTNERAALESAQGDLRALRATANAAGGAATLEGELQTAQVREQRGGADAARRGVALARSQAAAAGGAVAVAQAQVTAARSQLAAALAAVPAAQEALRKAAADRARYDALGREGYVPATTIDAAVAAVSQAKATLEAARAQVQAARAGVRMAEATLVQQRANAAAAIEGTTASTAQVPIALAKIDEAAAPSRVGSRRDTAAAARSQADAMAAKVRMARADVRDTRILAPADGWVAVRNASEGQMLAVGQAVVTISPADRIYVTANYKETQIHRIRAGMPVEIAIDACGGSKVRGTVTGFAPVAQNALSTLPTLSAPTNFVKVAQRVPVRIALPRSTGSCIFRPGTAVETWVLTE